MFLIIPLIVFTVCALAIIVMVWKKLPAIKALTPDTAEMHRPLGQGMFPEVYSHVQQLDVRGFWRRILQETEKGLRWFRLVLAKVVRISDRLIHRVRQEHLHSKSLEEVVQETNETNKESVPDKTTTQADLVAVLRQQEQTLISAISENPRNPQFYKELGDVYAKLKSYNDAKEAFETVLKLNPEDTGVQQKLSSVLQELPSDEPRK